MATKKEYRAALDRILATYYNLDNSISAGKKFNEDMKLLYGLVNDHFEEKQETNYEHFKDEIIENCMFNLAIVKGKPKLCNSVVYCSDCEFYVCKDKENNCNEKFKEWLKKPYEKQTYKLTQFEYDLLQLYKGKYSFKLSNSLRGMKEKGYFRSVDENAKIEDILESCEVIK